MHGVHKSMAAAMQAVTLPVAKARPSGFEESFGLTWQKAMKTAAVPQNASVAKGDEAASKSESTKSDEAAAKKDESAATVQEKTEVAADQDELGEQAEAQITPGALASTKTFVVAQMQKKTVHGDVAVEPKKQKASDGGDVVVVAETKPQAAAPDVSLMAVPVPVVVVPGAAPTAVKGESKGVAKAESAPGKKDRANAASGDAGKASVAETKPEAEDAKALPEVKVSPFEASAVPVAVTHATTTAASAADANGGVAQGMIAAVAPGLEHKAHGAAVTELQSAPVAAGGAEVNAAQALSAGTGQLEVGVLDGTHGWLKIRAEMGTDGSVSAMLTSSVTAHEGLKEAVPELATYLVSESVHVGRIAVQQAAESSAAGGDLTNAGGSGARDDGADRGYQSGSRGMSMAGKDVAQQDVDAAMHGISAAVFGAGARFRGNGIGSWLSVTA